MTLTEDENFSELDIDWFAVDVAGRIAHFATGGSGFIPAELVHEPQITDSAFDVLFNSNELTSALVIDDNLPCFDSDEKKTRYLTFFENMAKRGYFSYDVANPASQNSGYVLVAKPAEPLLLTVSACNDAQKASLPRFDIGFFGDSSLHISPDDWSNVS